MEKLDCVVAGAGVIGLAIARALSLLGRDVIILESAGAFGTGTSSRNSEVIHAGIYYAAGSLMARLCVSGRKALYVYCNERGIPHRKCGKLIVATTEQERQQLAAIAARAAANGVGDLHEISAAEAARLEPLLATTGALVSPSTGIVDSHSYMLALLGDAQSAGATLVLNCPVLGGTVDDEKIVLEVGGAEPTTLCCRLFVNAAGLDAPALANRLQGMPPALVPTQYYAKGSYFALAGRSPFSRLVYPVPVKGGLGIHLTLDMAGNARFGPDVEWTGGLDYSVDPARAEFFYHGIRRYYPALEDGALVPAYSGIRPKIVPPHVASQDFMIQGSEQHGILGLINLFGIESPGLTSSLALADYVCELASRRSL